MNVELTYHGIPIPLAQVDGYTMDYNGFPIPLPLSVLIHCIDRSVPYSPLCPIDIQVEGITLDLREDRSLMYHEGRLMLDCTGDNSSSVVEHILYLFSKGYYIEPKFLQDQSVLPILNVLDPFNPIVTRDRGETCEFMEHLEATITEIDE